METRAATGFETVPPPVTTNFDPPGLPNGRLPVHHFNSAAS